MEFHINKLGKIDKATIEMKDLTIICGPNSASKTWLSYSIYHHLSSLRNPYFSGYNYSEALLNDSSNTFDISSLAFRELLKSYIADSINRSNHKIHLTFNSYPDTFKESAITSEITDFYIDNVLDKIKELEVDIGMIGEDFRLLKKAGSSRFYLEDEEVDTDAEQEPEEISFSSREEVLQILMRHILNHDLGEICTSYRPFVITSERVGSLVFQKDIDGTALSIKDKLDDLIETYDTPEVEHVIREINSLTVGHRANLAVPVRKNLVAVRNAANELKKKSYLANEHKYVSDALHEIVKGKFSVEAGTLVFSASDNSHQLPITITSSSVKSLFIIDLYVNSLAQKGDVLLIDEPELNLHPDNQRLMAKVLARIANSGIKVIITTHSDYLIREINNAIMLSHDLPSKTSIMKKHGLIEEDLLKKEQVSAYSVSSEGAVTPMEVLSSGIDTHIFDDIIINANLLQEELYDELGA